MSESRATIMEHAFVTAQAENRRLKRRIAFLRKALRDLRTRSGTVPGHASVYWELAHRALRADDRAARGKR